MNIAIWDLDNCLSNDELRIAHIAWKHENPDKRYQHYHMFCGDDRPANRDIFDAVSLYAAPIFVTARPESVRSTTQAWIRRHLTMSHNMILMMRPNGVHLPSVQLKRERVVEIIKAGHRIVAAFDDRQDVVDMYRSFGISAARLWIHNTCAMTPPAPYKRIKEIA